MSASDPEGAAPQDDTEQQREAMRRIAEAHVKTSDFIARLMMVYTVSAAFCVFALLSPDRLMIDAQASLDMPIAGPVSFLAFMLVAPAVLIGMRVYIEVYVQRWRQLDAKLDPETEPETISPLKHPLLQFFSGLVLYFLLWVMLGVFTWKAAGKDVWGDAFSFLTLGDAFLFLTLVCAAAQVYAFIRWPWFFRAAHVAVVSGSLFVVVQHEGGLPHRGLDLFREDLSDAYLRGEDLRGAYLKEANLQEAVLSGANLQDAVLSGANLQEAVLSGANLQEADLSEANLQEAVLSGANLQEAVLFEANLQGADLREANLQKAHLERAELQKADLR